MKASEILEMLQYCLEDGDSEVIVTDGDKIYKTIDVAGSVDYNANEHTITLEIEEKGE